MRSYHGESQFFAAFQTLPNSARSLLQQRPAWPGKTWRNDQLAVQLSSGRRNVPFYDVRANALASADENRWFVENIRALSANGYFYRGALVICYPEEGAIYFFSGG